MGKNDNGRCVVPPLPEGVRYISCAGSAASGRSWDLIVTVHFMKADMGSHVVCTTLAGAEVARLSCPDARFMEVTLGQIRAAVGAFFGTRCHTPFLHLVTPGGTALTGTNSTSLGELLQPKARVGPQWEARLLRADRSR